MQATAEPHHASSSSQDRTPALLQPVLNADLSDDSLDDLVDAASPEEEEEEAFDTGALDEEHELQDDGNSVVNLSIGPLQRQLSSNRATDAQKNQALNTFGSRNAAIKDDGRAMFRGQEGLRERRRDVPELKTMLSAGGTVTTLPSPWTSRQKQDWKTHDGATESPPGRGARQRAQTMLPEHSTGLKKYLRFLPTEHLPKSLRPKEHDESSSSKHEERAATHPSHLAAPSAQPSATGSTADPSHLRPISQSQGRPQMIRRTTSDGSLLLRRTSSTASSLGDDSRWADVHAQVNVRFKAIKDSFADSLADSKAMRLPKFPELNLSFSNLQVLKSKSSLLDSRSTSPAVSERSKTYPLKGKAPSLGGGPTSPLENVSKVATTAHPHFSKALKHQKGDLVVLGGYRGSILRDAEPPNRQLWVPIKVGLNIRRVNLEVGLQLEDELNMPQTIIPGSMLANIGPVDISRRLFKKLRSSKHAQNGELRVWDYGYDWRLSPHLLSQQLITFLEGLPCNQPGAGPSERGATVIAHSLGGLITRHAINQRPELFSGVVFAGVPQNCVNILGPMRNGDDVLLSSKVLTAQVNFTFRTSFALLPLDGICFIDSETGEEYPVDFFDPQTWEEYRLSPCIARPLPPREQSGQPGPFEHFRGSISSVLPSITGRRNSSPRPASTLPPPADPADVSHGRNQTAAESTAHPTTRPSAVTPSMGNSTNPGTVGLDPEQNIKTAVTLPKDQAWQYLCRTLAEVKQFKQELAHQPALQESGRYPAMAAIYGKSIPTVSRAGVKGRQGIKCADAYDDLAFASGDGVVLARAAQLPEGYRPSRGGVVSSDRGHISLLTDLEAVGKCLNAVRAERVGSGATAATRGASAAV